MNERLFLVICLAVSILSSSSQLARSEEVKSAPTSGNIQWIYSYAEGQKAARESGKPLFVVFRCER